MQSLLCLNSIFILSNLFLAESLVQAAPERNPALIYWQAISLMPALSREENSLILDVTSGQTSSATDGVSYLLTKNETPLRLLKRAVFETKECDWGTLCEDGPFTVMPHINGIQQLSRLALVKAESVFTDGNNHDALEWILTAHKAARHTASGDMLVSALVQFGIEAQCLAVTGRHLLTLSEQERAEHLKALKGLPPLRTVAQAFGGELHYVDWAEKEFQGAKEATAAAELVQKLKAQQASGSINENSPTLPETEDVKKIREEFMQKALPIMMNETREYYKRAQAACAKPWNLGYTELEAIHSEIQDHGNYIIRQIYRSVTASRERELRLETERTMLMTALTMGGSFKEGPLDKFKDELYHLPLLVEKTKEGWEMKVMPNPPNGAPMARKAPMLRIQGNGNKELR